MFLTQRARTRQRVRSAILLITFLLFPIVMNFLSPYVIINGAFQGIITDSFLFLAHYLSVYCFSDAFGAVGFVRLPDGRRLVWL